MGEGRVPRLGLGLVAALSLLIGAAYGGADRVSTEDTGVPKATFISDAAIVLEYPSVYDVHTPLDPTQPMRSQSGQFLTETILNDLTHWIEAAQYNFVLLYSLQEVPGWINAGATAGTPAKNIGRDNGNYGTDPRWPDWPILYAAPHMNSVEFTAGETGPAAAFHEMGHQWGVYWARNSPGPRAWQPHDPLAWLASAGIHWTWPAGVEPGVWLDEGQPGILYSGAVSDKFNAFDLYAMGLMGYEEASTYTYNITDLDGNPYVLDVDNLISSLSFAEDPCCGTEGDGKRIPDTDAAMGELRVLIVVVKGADETLTSEHVGLIVELAEDLPEAWSVATWGRSSMRVQGATAGILDLALFDPASGQWHLRYRDGHTVSFFYGVPGDTPMMGDWDCDGTDTVAMYRESTGFIYYRNWNNFGTADGEFFFGIPGDIPIAGDWDNNGCDTFGIYRNGKVFLRNTLDTGFADVEFFFGVPGDRPFAGDFTGDGVDTFGLYRQSSGLAYFTETIPDGNIATTDNQFFYGIPSDRIIADDWDLDGDDSVGIYRPSDQKFYLSYENVLGNADVVVEFGQSSWLPAAGDLIPQDPGDSVNCGDFSTYSEALAWHDYYFHWYGDIANLDGDADGEPCESLPGAP